jgi:hypothetical protein
MELELAIWGTVPRLLPLAAALVWLFYGHVLLSASSMAAQCHCSRWPIPHAAAPVRLFPKQSMRVTVGDYADDLLL